MKDYLKPEVEYIDLIAESITNISVTEGENVDPFA